jgi:hypothetical protein
VDTTAPVVTIVTPVDGSIFIAPATFTVLADAQDPGGIISKVEFFLGTNKVGEVTGSAPYFVVLTNVPSGAHTLSARAIDGCGNSATSVSVNILVRENPPLNIISEMSFNPQTGLFDQTVRVSNPTGSTFEAVRVYVYGLTNNATVYNKSGTENGVPYVESFNVVPPGSYVDFIIEYYVPTRITPNPTLVPRLVSPSTRPSASGTPQRIERCVMLPNRTILLEFLSVTNRVYFIQYSSDLQTWQTVQPSITGNGTFIQWIDNGQPKTPSSPALEPRRFYRLLLLP